MTPEERRLLMAVAHAVRLLLADATASHWPLRRDLDAALVELDAARAAIEVEKQ